MNTMLLTIVGPHGRADVAAPADTPIAELLPFLAQLTAGGTTALAGWELVATGSGLLAADRSLTQAGVVDGAIVHLRPAGESRTAVHAGRPRLPDEGDDPGPLQRTRDTLPEWLPRFTRILPALKATRRRGRDADMGRVERACARWSAADYEPRLDELIRGPRLRRTATIAVVAAAPGSGTSTVTALLGTLLTHTSRDRPVLVDDVAGGRPPQHPPGRGGIHLLDCGAELRHDAIARADQLVLVCDARATTATMMAQVAATLGPAAPPVAVVVNGRSRWSSPLDPADLERALPHARGILGVSWQPRLARRLADGSFGWSEKARGWDVEVRELAALLAADWERVGVAAPAVRSADSPVGSGSR